MTQNSILTEAHNIIYGDREKTYGTPDLNLKRIAKIWEVIFGHSVTIEQVCHAMIGVKLARAVNSPDHRDTLVDLCGYAALIDRCHEAVPELKTSE